eukprot:3938156-Rhodomonas_salina.3
MSSVEFGASHEGEGLVAGLVAEVVLIRCRFPCAKLVQPRLVASVWVSGSGPVGSRSVPASARASATSLRRVPQCDLTFTSVVLAVRRFSRLSRASSTALCWCSSGSKPRSLSRRR